MVIGGKGAKPTCFNIHYVYKGPHSGMKPECMKFRKPCRNVGINDCPYKGERTYQLDGRTITKLI